MAFEGLSEKLQGIIGKLTGKGKVSEADVKAAMREVRVALLEADVNFKVVKDFVRKVSDRAVGSEVQGSLTPGQQVLKIVNEELTALMGSSLSKLTFSSSPITVYLLCGLQGAGKTTMAGKLALHLEKQYGKKTLLAACDIYRPAAIRQLQVVGEKVGVPVFEMGQIDPVQIAQAAVEEARRTSRDVVILDTAGRLHIDEALMEELQRVKTAMKPQEILLVVDAMTGQDAVNVAQTFDEKLGIDGVIVTKLDGDTRGGAALSVKAVTGKPIKFAGVGEKMTELEPFRPERMASRILGMGDVMTLIEKASQAFDQEQAKAMEQKLRESSFTLEDFLTQFEQMKNMGSMQDILAMLPGGNKLSAEDIDEKQMARTEAIIRSMTPKERLSPEIIGASRKRRIAAGSGTRVQDVNRLLKQFDSMRQLVKQLSGKGARRAMRGMRGMKLPF